MTKPSSTNDGTSDPMVVASSVTSIRAVTHRTLRVLANTRDSLQSDGGRRRGNSCQQRLRATAEISQRATNAKYERAARLHGQGCTDIARTTTLARRFLECCRKITRRLETVGGILREEGAHDFGKARFLGWQSRRHLGGRCGDVLFQKQREVACEWAATGQKLEEDDAEGIQIGSCIDRAAEDLLGGHVLGRSEHGTALGEVRTAIGDLLGIDSGHAEVEEFDEIWIAVPLHQHDVFGLQITVDDSFFVRCAQAGDHATHDAERPRRSHRSGLQLGAQTSTVHEFHDQEERAVGQLSKVRRGNDIGMLDSPRRDGFPFEASHQERAIGVAGVQDLQREDFAELQMLGTIHCPHSAFGNEREDPIPASDFGAFCNRVRQALRRGNLRFSELHPRIRNGHLLDLRIYGSVTPASSARALGVDAGRETEHPISGMMEADVWRRLRWWP